jgi:hypothetical protein
MSKALKEIDRIRALIEWRCNRGEIRKIHEPLKADVADVERRSTPVSGLKRINQSAPILSDRWPADVDVHDSGECYCARWHRETRQNRSVARSNST